MSTRHLSHLSRPCTPMSSTLPAPHIGYLFLAASALLLALGAHALLFSHPYPSHAPPGGGGSAGLGEWQQLQCQCQWQRPIISIIHIMVPIMREVLDALSRGAPHKAHPFFSLLFCTYLCIPHSV